MGAEYHFTDSTIRPNRDYYYMVEEVAKDGTSRRHGPQKVVYGLASGLAQCTPNPFRASTIVPYSIGRDGHVLVSVYDVRGRRVRTLVDEVQRADTYHVEWDGRNDSGELVSSGVYFYRLQSAKISFTKKTVLLR